MSTGIEAVAVRVEVMPAVKPMASRLSVNELTRSLKDFILSLFIQVEFKEIHCNFKYRIVNFTMSLL